MPILSDNTHDQQYYSTEYADKFNNVNLESRGIYLVEHDAFTLPNLNKSVFDTEYLGGGKRTYASPQEKQISLTVKVENKYLSNIDQNLRQVFGLFYTNTPAPLVIAERPDRYIDCILSGAVSIADTPGFTAMQLHMIAPLPFFRSNDVFDSDVTDFLVLDGNAPHYPIFTIKGPATNPALTINNGLKSATIAYNGSLGTTDVLTIDSLQHLVLYNGSPVNGAVSGGIIPCRPGENHISLSSGTLHVKTPMFYY